jgi:DNA-binding NarL/FixJ family response regulator
MSDPLAVAVVDAHAAMRDAIVETLDADARFEVVLKAHDIPSLSASTAEFDVCLLDMTVDGHQEDAVGEVMTRHPTVVWTDRVDWQIQVRALAMGALSVLPRAAGHPDSVATALLHAGEGEAHISPQLASALLDAAASGALAWSGPQAALLTELTYGTRPDVASERAGLSPARFAAERSAIIAACRATPLERLDPRHVVPIGSMERPRLIERLTERQIQILAMLADGYSRSAVAAELHISPKTLESHLANVLVKIHVARASTAERLLLAMYFTERHRNPHRLWETRIGGLIAGEE